MKNVLLLTNIYPNNDPKYEGTHVCHFFTKEWVKMGYCVRVAHFDSLFPKPYYWVGKLFMSRIQAKTGAVTYTKTPRKSIIYTVEGVPVMFVPILKVIPHRLFSKKRMQVAFDIVCRNLEHDNFKPDIITGHFTIPQLQMIAFFKKKWPYVKTCLVLHNAGENIPSIYKNYMELMSSVDIWGLRSKAFKEKFELFYHPKRDFVCYSGIPENYIKSTNKDFSNGVKKFAFVGSLYELKRVDDTIRALNMAFPDGGYTFTVAGAGAEMDRLKRLCVELNVQNNVTFLGQIKRDEAQEVMREADCFIMVSTRESYGLVYVEAMAKGCITIATRGQGGDGIINDGVNGFLCESSNPRALADLILSVSQMTSSELSGVSANAVVTASNLTNIKVAEQYINSIIS